MPVGDGPAVRDAEQCLDVMADLVRDHVGLREVAEPHPELSRERREEPRIEVHAIRRRAVERTGGGALRAAGRAYLPPEGSSDEELASAARNVLDELHARQLSELRERFQQRSDQDRSSTDVATVARAATYGAVDTVIVDIDEKVPGFVDDASGEVTFAEEDDAVSYGVVDEIVRRVVLSGGRVFAVRAPDVPGGGPVAAILRYAL